jgi:hypothetical protein
MNILSYKYGSNSREFSKLNEGRILIFSLTLVLLLGIPNISSGIEDWQKEYDQLKAKIEREELEPRTSPKNINEYRKWMRIKAADRNKATELAGKAQLSGNPYWQNKFLDLKELAQDSGNTTLWTGGYVFMRVKTKGASGGADSWESAVFKAGPEVGQKLFRWAEEFGFDREIIRDYARCLMRFANGDVEEGNTGLYKGRRSELGHIDQEGNLAVPNRDFDVNCERRDEFTTVEEGEPIQPADTAMEMVDEIREQCKWYKLQGEYDDSTDLMEEYLQEKKVLCDLPKDKGHYFFLKLAEKYDLPEAEEYIDGFYATISGKVELDTMEGRKPASGAKVTVKAPKDKEAPKNRREWTTITDEDGKYKMKGVILHKDCSPFEITAEHRNCEEKTEFVGPLEAPDSSYEYKKDLLIFCPRILEVDCVWSTDFERFPQSHDHWGGKANIKIYVRIVEEKINGSTIKTLQGSGQGSQECWVKIDRPQWIENVRYSKAIDVAIKGTPIWFDVCNFMLTSENAGLSWEVVEDRDGREYRWPNKDLGLQKVLSSIIFTMTAKPDSVFQESGEDILKTYYKVTARWKK